MSEVLSNLIEVYSEKKSWVISILIFALSIFIFSYFTQADVIRGNLGESYYDVTFILQIVISILFAMFISLTVHKLMKFSSFSAKEGATSGVGFFLGVLVAGCAACSISLAGYLGLASVVAFLPWYGLELKLIALPLLLYANYVSLKDLQLCKIKRKKLKNK